MKNMLLFVTGPLPGAALPATFDPALVVLSYIVATLAAYTAIDLAGRVNEFRAESRRAAAWLAGGAFAMGAGIWSMHFVGMLAYQLPIHVRYEPWTTLASMAAAITTSGFALYIVTRGTLSWPRLLISGAVMGAGIGTMHYTGMAAMRLDALVMYYIAPWLLSVVNAIVCSTIALWLVFRLGRSDILYRVLAALVMGVAIAGMHYTGMYAAVCVSTGQTTAATGLDPAPLAAVIGVVTLLIMGIALTVSLQSQLMSRTLREQNDRLRHEVEQRRCAETELQHHRDNLQALVDDRTRALSRALLELQGSEARKGGMLESALDCVICMDASGNITEFNPSAEATFGYRRTEVLGKNLSSTIIPQSMREAHNRGLKQYIATGNGPILGKRIELSALRADGSEFPVELDIRAIQVDGHPLFAAYLRDITERKRAELTLQEARDAAQAASRAKSEFLASMSHEIRTPLNGVLGMTELLLGTPLDVKQRRFAEIAHRSGVALLGVINDVLDFSKIEAGRFELQINPFNVRDLVEDVVEAMAEGARRKTLELSCAIPAVVPARVQGDDNRLRQILINLTGNAIKFTERGEVLVRVALMEETADSVLLRFEFKDTGIGIADDQVERIFGAFTQAEGQSIAKFGGTGLGLSICKQLVEKMGGAIGVSSAPGIGSTFWFTLRLAKQPNEAAAAAAEQHMLGLRALIVDDNATNREVLGHQLAVAGLTHDESDDGARALEKLRAAAAQGKPFDIAVIDEQMPGMDGIELARVIHADALHAALPIIMLSSLGSGERTAHEAGVAYCLTRPLRQSQLYDCLVSVLSREISAVSEAQTQTVAVNLQAHVLLAEDHPVNQELALAMLERLGCRAAVANDGREALAALERTPFDLILMDCQMPEMDGFEATAEIRRREAARSGARRVPIIALTAGAVVGDREKCLAAGMDDYVTKPFSLEQLEGALRRCLLAERKAEKSAPCIDLQVLERIRAISGERGADLVTKIIGVYLKDAPGRLRSLQEQVARRDTAAMGHTAHAFKSACANLGAAALAELCQRMESLGRAGSTSGADSLAAEIEMEYARVAAELSAHGKHI